MTWEEAKDQIAFKHFSVPYDKLLVLGSQLKVLEEAAQLYAREVADKAWEAGWDRCDQRWINSLKEGYKITAPNKEEFMRQLFPEK